MPADDSLGPAAGWTARPAAKTSLFAVSHCTFQDAEEILRRAGPTAHARDPDARFRRWRDELKDGRGGADCAVRSIRHLRNSRAAGRADLERELNFFRKYRSRMRNRELQDRKLPIGSGIAEAANKTLVACRMKGSGMRWSMAGGQAAPAFRAPVKSGRFDRAREAMTANDNRAAALQPLAA